MTGLALNCTIQEHNVFARKNYFYPDLPKGYQISQYELPLCRDGSLEIEVSVAGAVPDRERGAGANGGDATRSVRIRRVHLEEDTGKLMHVDGYSLVDFNRAGVPLMEVVSEADMRSAEEAYAFVTRLRQIVRYLGVSSGDMEKGAMRCEVNLSLRLVGSYEFGTKVEVKNLNSFRSVRNAIAYEIKRQTRLLEAEEPVKQVTMGWDEAAGVTREQRSKEEAHDYRYFPEPDLPPLEISREWVEDIRARLPELPDAKEARFVSEYELGTYDSRLLVEDRAVLVQGQVQKDEKSVKILAVAVIPIEKAEETWAASVHFNLEISRTDRERLEHLHAILQRHPGLCPAFLHLRSPDNTDAVIALPEWLKLKAGSSLTRDVNGFLGYHAVETHCSKVPASTTSNGGNGREKKVFAPS